ncbi:radical SAM superfamily protein [Sphingomonas sp. S17]|uniref:PA0069 family radical SAM protein n=3 Tax=Pseudomonadota TaxID=1224 RepID=A0A411LF00_SPHPI|nr:MULTISPECIES: PA0069 family radical SAM protein [Sphingomonas]EGI56791.1 radical SAM superfamily protein [Sphingomonas sp. S17]MBQ1480172.1 PA0069 family radical SAM protein [Sphingomonas sp.]MCM3678925.1 PA0069 family radical SAM protein [Sphingomonas paucimobilis]MDG5971677.1 PA0069 family radical SAM protein [Sphingomonas paucimobilis]NNG58309.1 PA0069 family radical SAM protein [Sphingomonas paucimobilis]
MGKPDQPKRAQRGATVNAISRRFALPESIADGDWLDAQSTIDGSPPPLRTSVTVEQARTILSRNSSPDVPFDRSINPYRGCEHGCIYCFARPTHAYHDLSPGLDFESRLFAKPNAAELLRVELAKPSYRVAPIALGTNTDPYQPIEGEWRITRAILQVLAETNHPVAITTKSDRIVGDLDILGSMATKGLATVCISVTSLDAKVARTVEPRAPTPERRLAAVGKLAAAGIPTYVSIAPVIPAITDHEIEHLVARAAEAGARHAFFIPVRLPHEVAPLFRAWLDTHFPERAGKVMAIIQSLRGGRDNDPDFFTRMRGQGPWADLLRVRFHRACRLHGLNRDRPMLDTSQFRPPKGPQGELF